MASIILTLLLLVSFHIDVFSFDFSEGVLQGGAVLSPPFLLVSPNDMKGVFLTVNESLQESQRYSKKVKNLLEMANFLVDVNNYPQALIEYRRASFYIKNKLDDKNSIIDSLRYEVLLGKARTYFLLKNFRESQQIAERIVEDYLSRVHSENEKNIVPGLEANLLIVENFVYSQRFALALSEIRNIYLDFDVDNETDFALRRLRDIAISLSSNSVEDSTKIEDSRIRTLFIENIEDTRYKNPLTAYRLSVIPGAGHFYAGDIRGGVGAFVTNTFLLTFLATRIFGIAFHAEQYFNYGRRESDFNRIIVNSVDFFIVYQMLFNRYYRGAANTIATRVEENNERLFELYKKSVMGGYDF